MSTAHDDDDQLDRIRQLCAAVDDVHAEAQRVFRQAEDSRSAKQPTWPPDAPDGPEQTEHTPRLSASGMPVDGDSER